MKITILTLFPEMFVGPFDHSIIKRALDNKLLEINFVNLRDFGEGPHKTVDDKPYGGGAGMILKVDVIDEALKKVKNRGKIVLLDPRGKVFNQKMAWNFSKLDHLVLICGHYEGVDERVKKIIDETISVGDYVLTGGEIPAMVITDSVCRLLPKVLSKKDATRYESFSRLQTHNPEFILEYPQYTRPPEFKGMKVPPVLLSGDHQKIEVWREKEAYKLTKKRRPDLLKEEVI
ncbi:MAG: tRNA (guanosine(37)-N1)-methyltransferase TrmD [Patescibacteria group bacterium]|nr:tRNA (guanosine(37)-N1)-methyltransferase TrmD [Patescibacteria group bacterium]MCL5095426.1 tRNA (guanosine(37)-N1)-methyltransferase TrmD [Patescibacteria group bacterium]